MRIRPLGRAGCVAFGLLWGCASVPDPPPPVVVEAPTSEELPFDGAAGWPLDLDWHGSHRLPDPPAVWLVPSVNWEPREPRTGTAVAIRIQLPEGGAVPIDVTAELGGRRVRLGEVSDGWFGVAALPLDDAGLMALTTRFAFEGDSSIELGRSVAVRSRTYDQQRFSIAARGPADPELDARIARERQRIGAAIRDFSFEWLGGDGFAWPRPHDVTSSFGQRRVFRGQTRSRHLGLDLRGDRGEIVRAPADGRIALVGDFYYQGNAVYIDHGLGVFSGLFHLSVVDVGPGERVERGQIIGRVGSTGRSTAPHLHWSAYVGGQNVDPASLFGLTFPVDRARQSALPAPR